MKSGLVTGLVLTLAAVSAPAAEWPTYRGDAARSGYTAEVLPAKPRPRWTYKPAHPPTPAWPDEKRMAFDRAHHVVCDGKSVYFGNSTDCKVYALDAATGRERWSFFTDGPVRFAPALWKDRLFATSDDGYLYCLAKTDGKLVWKKRPSPSGRKVLGNGRVISKWPARGGPVVVDDVVYFGAGIWPTDGTYLCALRAADGTPVWIKDKIGSLSMHQPHGARARSGVSIQGYLAVSGDKLLTPAGRGPYACFDLSSGKLLYHHLGSGWSYGAFGPTVGGSQIVAADPLVFHGGLWVCQLAGGKGSRFRDSGLQAGTVAIGPKRVYFWSGKALVGIDRAKPFNETGTGKKKELSLNEVWRAELGEARKESLILAGGAAVLGGVGEVSAVDIAAKKTSWTAKVEGTAYGLAVAGGRLFVSTDAGHVYCFGEDGGSPVVRGVPATGTRPAGGPPAVAAGEILKLGGVREGYCLLLGCGDGRLASELARITKLRIIGVEKDAARVAAARKMLSAAGLYGSRVTVLQGDPTKTDLPNCFADLVVSPSGAVPQKEALRCARPYGGVICLGKPGVMKKTVRGPLKGAGEWTHQYADAGNSGCSRDEIVRGPLSVLWFTAPVLKMPSRHGRSPAPLAAAGRLFVQGLDEIVAVDAYNGRLLWRCPSKGIGAPWNSNPKIPGVAASGSNICTDGSSVYVAVEDRCLRLDAASGKKLAEFKAPAGKAGPPARWTYVACEDEMLFGMGAGYGGEKVPRTHRSALRSKSLFALDAKTGKLKWHFQAEHGIRQSAVAVGGGSVYLIDRPGPDFTGWSRKSKTPPKHPRGSLVALEADTGRAKWRRKENIYGTTLALDEKRQTLVMFYQASMSLYVYQDVGGRFAAFRAEDGSLLHDSAAKYATRPVIVGDRMHSNSGAWDLATGKAREEWSFRKSYGCGVLAAGKHILAFRSGCVGYYDLDRKAGTENFGGVRPGCWLNTIPAGGLLLVPDYSAGCNCSYQMRANVALEPKQ
ncbi:MAG: outer membrane protein assembly factor BamB family protein [Planctomycetota bacterium]|jgi:outer membrane protein assembly factor BamB